MGQLCHEKGRLCGLEDETGSYSYSYDAHGNLLEEQHQIDGVTYTTSYSSYDKEDRMAMLALPNGRVVEYNGENIRQVRGISTEVNGQKQAIVSEISCRADGERTGCLYGNGLSGKRVCDQQGRLLRRELGVRSAGNWSSKSWERHYQYDTNSNLVRCGPRPDESEQNYGYDGLDRLEEERKAGPPEERQGYKHDLSGNQLREKGKQEIEHFLEGSSNRIRATEEFLLQLLPAVLQKADATTIAMGFPLSVGTRRQDYFAVHCRHSRKVLSRMLFSGPLVTYP